MLAMTSWQRASFLSPVRPLAIGLALASLAAAVPAQTTVPAEPGWAQRLLDMADDRAQPSPAARDAGVQAGSAWSAQFSPGTWHANYSAEHVHSVAFGVRYSRSGDDFYGLSLFRNSFGQPSAYALYGQRLHGGVPALPKFYVEWTAGIMYGYVGEKSQEVPLNVRGLSPVFTISPGWQITPQLSGQLNVIGTVAVMLQFDWRFP
jgi:hypothetical protein